MPGNKITSPDQLNNYIRVTSPGIWIVLAAILVLLAGLFFWLFTGQLEVCAHTPIFTRNSESFAFIPRENLHGVAAGTPARILNTQTSGTVTAIASEPLTFMDIESIIGRNAAAKMMIDYSSRSLCMVSLNIPGAPQGVSQAVIVIDTVKPISFLLRQHTHEDQH